MNDVLRLSLALSLLTVPACFRPITTVERDFDVGSVDRIIVDDGAGDIDIVGESGRTTLTLVVELRSDNVSRRDDDDAERSIELDYIIEDGVGRIVQHLVDPPEGYHLDLIAHVPSSMALEISDSSGDIAVSNVAGLDIDQRSGDLHASDVAGDVFVRHGAGDVAIEDVDGRIEVSDGSGDIAIDGARADVVIDDGSGDIHVRTEGDVDVVADGGGDVDIG